MDGILSSLKILNIIIGSKRSVLLSNYAPLINALVLTLLSTDAGIENVRIVEGLQVYGLQSQTGA